MKITKQIYNPQVYNLDVTNGYPVSADEETINNWLRILKEYHELQNILHNLYEKSKLEHYSRIES